MEDGKNMTIRTYYLLLRMVIGAGIGIILTILTGDIRFIPGGVIAGALSQFAGYGFGGYGLR